MDFENCLMVCVLVDDVVEVDKIFDMLMGDWVELWCEFIEVNVVYSNLDI